MFILKTGFQVWKESMQKMPGMRKLSGAPVGTLGRERRQHLSKQGEMGWSLDTSPIHSLYRAGLTRQAQSFLLRRNVHRNVTHPLSTPKPHRHFHKCHNPQRTQGESHPEKSLCSPGKNSLLQTQGLPEGTGKVINSLHFSQNTFEERQRITSRVRKTVIFKHCKHAGWQSCLPQLPQLYRFQDVALASKLKVFLSWKQLCFPTPPSLASSSITNNRWLCPFGHEAHRPVIGAGITQISSFQLHLEHLTVSSALVQRYNSQGELSTSNSKEAVQTVALIPQIWVADEEAALQGHCLREGQQRGSGEKFLQNPSFIHRFVPGKEKRAAPQFS